MISFSLRSSGLDVRLLVAAPIVLVSALAGCEDGGTTGGAVEDVQDERPRPRTDSGRGDTDDENDATDATAEDSTISDSSDRDGSGVDTDVTVEPDADAGGDATTVEDTAPIDVSVDVEPDVPVDPGPPPADLDTDTFDCPGRWPDSTIRITEVMIDPNNAEGQRTSTEWFEVTNIGSTAVDMDGARIADLNTDELIIGEETQPYEGFYQLADDSEIEPGEWFPFYQRVTTVDCRGSTDADCKAYVGEHFYVFRRDLGMAIGNSGDEIYIYDDAGHLLDCFDYNSSDETEGQSWQRYPTEDGAGFTDTWCVTYLRDHLRYNDNDDDVRDGDYGTPGAPFRCW
jgi:hypothetical protein